VVKTKKENKMIIWKNVSVKAGKPNYYHNQIPEYNVLVTESDGYIIVFDAATKKYNVNTKKDGIVFPRDNPLKNFNNIEEAKEFCETLSNNN
jgi:RIO-like serine/threonine protein kinase